MGESKKDSKKEKTIISKMSRPGPLKVQETRTAHQKSYQTREAPQKTKRIKSDSN